MSTPFTPVSELPHLPDATPEAASLAMAAAASGGFNLNWLLKMAGYGEPLPAHTAPSTPAPHGGGIRPAGAAAAAAAGVAGVVQEVHAAADSGSGVLAGQRAADADGGPSGGSSGGGFGFGSRRNRGVRGIGNVFNYLTSPWALLFIFMTILLNRTLLYASLRTPTRLSWRLRLLIRIVPILLFLSHIHSILYASDTGGFFYYLSRLLTPWHPSSSSDVAVCQSFGMLPRDGVESFTPTGSLSVLWPLYRSISIGLFLATFSHALQSSTSAGIGIPSTSSDTGLTLFEDSLVFAEAEALVDPKTGNVSPEVLYIALISAFAHLTANIIGVLGIATGIAAIGHYRLITTGIWGVAFLGGFMWALFRGGAKVLGFPTVCVVGFIPHLIVLLGIAICGAIYLLAAIFSTLVARSRRSARRGHHALEEWNVDDYYYPPTAARQLDGSADEATGSQQGSSRGRGFLDFSNLQANITLSSLSISWSEDFYTTLLKLGFQCLTAASEATYLNEGAPIRVPGLTWLERERLRVLERQRVWAERGRDAGLSRGGGDAVEMAMLRTGTEGNDLNSGYANERREGVQGGYGALGGIEDEDEEGTEGANGRGRGRRKLGNIRATRWFGAVEYMGRELGVGGAAKGRDTGGRGAEWPYSEQCGRCARGSDEKTDNDATERAAALQILREKWVDDDEHRRRLWETFVKARSLLPDEDEGTGFASDDEYVPSPSDATSVVSKTSAGSGPSMSSFSRSSSRASSILSYDGYGSDTTTSSISMTRSSASPGARTPTRRNPYPSASSVPTRPQRRHHRQTHDEDDDWEPLTSLATLLDPQTPEQRSQARIMAQHLLVRPGTKPVTRSLLRERQRDDIDRDPGAVSSSPFNNPYKPSPSTSHYPYFPPSAAATATPYPIQETRILEHLLLTRRRRPQEGAEEGDDEGVGMGMCVICHTNPRTIVLWPCRCLALCEDCRVALAMRNYGTCVCCRREVGGVSRVFVV
ncbi:hypothetical protein BDZ91DRAFT_725708 [Kalaharituber pfeilii]|nr:hypothetical protein BDZ91DRAFT_725708 [Kalaharituber pfeilii]